MLILCITEYWGSQINFLISPTRVIKAALSETEILIDVAYSHSF